MDIASKFELEIDRCLPLLANDEWALSNASDQLVDSLEPYEAFDSITPMLLLAETQSDSYAFVSCCWLAHQLANISNTTEQPEGLIDALKKVHVKANRFDEYMAKEVLKIARFYRVENAI